jgi:transcriptional regulator with XRE-family HTH domain
VALAEIIERNNLKGYEIAEAVGVAPETLSRWCQGRMTPSGENVGRLLHYLSKRLRRKVRYEDLFAPSRATVGK